MLTVSLKLLYALVIVHHGLRRLVTVGVTLNPTADWVAGQVTAWNEAPWLLIRDRDGAYGDFLQRRNANGIQAVTFLNALVCKSVVWIDPLNRHDEQTAVDALLLRRGVS